MKIRKALEKAKTVREEDILTGPKSFAGTSSAGTDVNTENLIPDYSESTEITLDYKKINKNHCVAFFADAPENNSYKVLRTQILQRTRVKNWNTIMITSAHKGEGKTLTSINLALTFAKQFNQTALLVDADLLRQDIHKSLGFASNKGLGDYLMGKKPLKELIYWPGIEKLSIISGGNSIQESTELLESPKMSNLVHEMKNRYKDRYVFFDVPPLLEKADAIAFAPMVDCVLMVVQAGKTSMEDVKKALEYIPKEKFLGFVLNRQNEQESVYYY